MIFPLFQYPNYYFPAKFSNPAIHPPLSSGLERIFIIALTFSCQITGTIAERYLFTRMLISVSKVFILDQSIFCSSYPSAVYVATDRITRGELPYEITGEGGYIYKLVSSECGTHCISHCIR